MTLLQASKTVDHLTLRNRMILIRVLEDKLQELCLQGKGGDLHFSTGQEAISVGVCAALRETDYVVTHHRTIAHAIAKDVPLYPLVAEILGKRTGINNGFAGEMHMSYPPKRFMFCWQLVGTCVPVAAGIAWAVKHYQKTDDVVVVFHGDAAASNGQWHEGMNLASVQKIPLLVVCENNGLAGNVRSTYYSPFSNMETGRAAGYGIHTERTDGNNVEAVHRTTAEVVNYVRNTQSPAFLECHTNRLGRHKQGQGDLRSKEELAELSLRDPLRDVTPEERAPFACQVDEVIKKVMADSYPGCEMLT